MVSKMDDEGPSLGDAAAEGLRRASAHVARAGYELMRGVAVFLEELGKAVGDDEEADGEDDRHRVPVEDDE